VEAAQREEQEQVPPAAASTPSPPSTVATTSGIVLTTRQYECVDGGSRKQQKGPQDKLVYASLGKEDDDEEDDDVEHVYDHRNGFKNIEIVLGVGKSQLRRLEMTGKRAAPIAGWPTYLRRCNSTRAFRLQWCRALSHRAGQASIRRSSPTTSSCLFRTATLSPSCRSPAPFTWPTTSRPTAEILARRERHAYDGAEGLP